MYTEQLNKDTKQASSFQGEGKGLTWKPSSHPKTLLLQGVMPKSQVRQSCRRIMIYHLQGLLQAHPPHTHKTHAHTEAHTNTYTLTVLYTATRGRMPRHAHTHIYIHTHFHEHIRARPETYKHPRRQTRAVQTPPTKSYLSSLPPPGHSPSSKKLP